MGIVRVLLSDPMCRPSPKPNVQIPLCLNDIVEWGMFATTTGRTLVEWRLMGHTMVPLSQRIGGGLEHDCSTWDQENAANAWNDPTKAEGTNERTPAKMIFLGVPLATATALQCEVYVEMLNGFLLWIAENEVLGFR